MKVALILSGQGRSSLKSSFNSIKKHILDVYDTDVYCHLWWDEEISKNGFYVGLQNTTYSTDNNMPEIIKNLYSPKKMLIQPQINVWAHPDLLDINCPSKESFISQLYGLQEVSNLFNWSDYDFIIKWRYDLEVVNFMNLNELDKTKLHTFCHVLNENGETDLPFPTNFFDDPGYILPNDMKQFLQFIDNINDLKLYGSDCVPENIISRTLELLGLNYKLKRHHINKFYGNILRV
jgi:hypothetical protein